MKTPLNNAVKTHKTIMETMLGKDYESFFCNPVPNHNALDNYDANQPDRPKVEESDRQVARDEARRELVAEHSQA